eukprot:jgi/Chlat1/4282/Chrsp29S04557
MLEFDIRVFSHRWRGSAAVVAVAWAVAVARCEGRGSGVRGLFCLCGCVCCRCCCGLGQRCGRSVLCTAFIAAEACTLLSTDSMVMASSTHPPHKRKRLAGGSLSLEKFVDAKSSNYYGGSVEARRKSYLKQKKLQKLKKLKLQMQQEAPMQTNVQGLDEVRENAAARTQKASNMQAAEAPSASNAHEAPQKRVRTRGHEDAGPSQPQSDITPSAQGVDRKKKAGSKKGVNQLEIMRRKREEQQAAEQRRRAESLAAQEEQRHLREASANARKEFAKKLRKKTSRGQPVMKHRIERMLYTLERQS